MFHQDDCPCCSGFGRREILRAAVGLGCVAVTPMALAAGESVRSLSIFALNTRESFSGVYWRNGVYDQSALQRMNWVLRDHRTNKSIDMEQSLFDLLFAVNKRLGSNVTFEVISAYRAPETNAMRHRQSRGVARNSRHMSGQAIDVRVDGKSPTGLAELVASMQEGGVGLYRRSGFVHVDVGPVRRW